MRDRNSTTSLANHLSKYSSLFVTKVEQEMSSKEGLSYYNATLAVCVIYRKIVRETSLHMAYLRVDG